MRDPPLEEILARRGAVTRIAAGLGISIAAVSQWQRVPADRVAELARLLDLPPHRLRPDLYPPPAEPHPSPEGNTPRMATRIPLRRRRRTKIVATLGPATSTPEVIERLYRAGADVFRLNFSHGTHADHAERIEHHPRAGAEGRPADRHPGGSCRGPSCGSAASQGGPGAAADRPALPARPRPDAGQRQRRVQLPHPEIFKAAQTGTSLLLDDGKLRLRVVRAVRDDHLETEVVVGGAAVATARASTCPTSRCRSRR